jgi:hypothetical protein
MIKLAPLSLNLTKLVFKEFKEEMQGAALIDARGRIDCAFSVYKQNITKLIFFYIIL